MTATATDQVETWEPLQPGVHPDVPEVRYHADPAVSSTTLRRILDMAPAKLAWKLENPEHRDYFDLGTVVHTLTLRAGLEPVVVEADSWRTNDAKKARAKAWEQGVPALLEKDLARATAMVKAVHEHPLAGRLVAAFEAVELTVVADDPVTGVRRRARLDGLARLGDQLIGVDLKTTTDAAESALPKSIEDKGYHQQDDHYRRTWDLAPGAGQPLADFLFMFVEKDPPHLVQVARTGDDLRLIAADRNARALTAWAELQALPRDQWPGFPVDVVTVPAPRWAKL